MGISLPLYHSQILLLPEKSIRKFHFSQQQKWNRHTETARRQWNGENQASVSLQSYARTVRSSLPVSVTKSSSGLVVIRYVLLVFWMMSRRPADPGSLDKNV